VNKVEEMRRKREARRAAADQEKARRAQEISEHGDHAGRVFRGMVAAFRQQLPSAPLRERLKTEDGRIAVCVRKRPMFEKEKRALQYDAVTVHDSSSRVMTVHEAKRKVDNTPALNNVAFTFDRVFDEHSSTDDVYASAVAPLIQCASQGGAATVFAYGQTGSGKTHTMGPVCRRAIAEMLSAAQAVSSDGEVLEMSLSYFEIYLSEAFDLLSEPRRAPVRLLEDENGAVQVRYELELGCTAQCHPPHRTTI
jgi:kinesin family protein 2/24